jgi:predicted aldo/keto reductase-like oxidoreductase
MGLGELTFYVVQFLGAGSAGPQVFGPPRDVDTAIAVLREAAESGVNHIDTSDYYGPHVTNQIMKRALHPYRDGLGLLRNWALVAMRTSLGFDQPTDQVENKIPAADRLGPTSSQFEERAEVLCIPLRSS